MNINFEISDIKKRTEGDAEEKIMQLVDIWDGCINDIMRELVRIYDSIVVTPQDGRGCTSYKMEKRLEKCFRLLVKEMFDNEDEPI